MVTNSEGIISGIASFIKYFRMRKISHSWKTKLSHGIEEPLNKKYNGEWYRYSFGESGIVKEAKEFLIVVKK